MFRGVWTLQKLLCDYEGLGVWSVLGPLASGMQGCSNCPSLQKDRCVSVSPLGPLLLPITPSTMSMINAPATSPSTPSPATVSGFTSPCSSFSWEAEAGTEMSAWRMPGCWEEEPGSIWDQRSMPKPGSSRRSSERSRFVVLDV